MRFSFFHRRRDYQKSLFRSSIFGLEDSLVSSVGFLSGYVATGVPSLNIIRSGLILIVVEAFSMGVGTFLSENSSEEIVARKQVRLGPAIHAGFAMFISYLLGGLLVLSPYFFTTPKQGSLISLFLSLCGLSVIGFVTAYYAKTNYITEIAKSILIGGLAATIGFVVGSLLDI